MILITGASGNVGREVLRQAAAAGLKLRAAYQTADKAAQAPAGVETVLMDYGKPETLRAAFHGIEKLFLVGPPTADLAQMEANAVDEAKRASVPHIVSLSALGGRNAVFPSMHADNEEHIKASGIPYTFLRPNGFMQNFVNYDSGTIKTQNAFYGSVGNGAVSHIDLRDIAAAAVKVLSWRGHEGKTYPLTGPEALTNAQVAEKISRAVGRKITYVDLAPADLKKALLAAGVPEWSADALLDLQRLYREGGASLIDPTFQQLTSRKATTFDQFVSDYAAAFRSVDRAAS
jgi:uncharacterized protein YbjT (DUF2867 family)